MSDKMTMIQCVFKGDQLYEVQKAMEDIGVVGMTIWEVKGHGRQKGHVEVYRGREYKVDFLTKARIEMVVANDRKEEVIRVLAEAARSGAIGDGKIFVEPVVDAIRIRNEDRGEGAL